MRQFPQLQETEASVDEDRSTAAAMLALDGFRLLGADVAEGEVYQLVETTADGARCAACGFEATAHGRRTVKVRDLPVAGRPGVLCWRKRIRRCGEPTCDVVTWTERSEEIRPRRSCSERARREMCRRVGEDADSVAQVARDFGVGWATVMEAVREYGQRLVDDPERIGRVDALGLDETSFQGATPERSTTYVTGFVDLLRPRLLDVVEDRSGGAVAAWLGGRPEAWREAVSVVALDPHRGYSKGLLSHMAHATVVLDHFHGVGLANRAVDLVRRRVQNETLGHRGRKGEPLYGIRKKLVTAHERLSERGWEALCEGLRRGDPFDEVGSTYLAKELLREVWSAGELTEARRRLVAFYTWCAEAEVPELTTLAATISSWEREVLAYHTTHLSNGPTEGMNLLVKKVKRVGAGFQRFDNYRLRLLLHCGVEWKTRPTARLRGRSPRLAA